jgi:hypothetical protein
MTIPRWSPLDRTQNNPGTIHAAFCQTIDKLNQLVQGYLNPHPCLIRYYNDPGIHHTIEIKGKGDGRSPGWKNQICHPQYAPSCPTAAGIHSNIVQAESGNALDAGKRYRLTSGHAPVFSLITFFGSRL